MADIATFYMDQQEKKMKMDWITKSGVETAKRWLSKAVCDMQVARSTGSKMEMSMAQARVDDVVDILNSLYDGRECGHCGSALSVDTCDVCGNIVEDGCMYCHLDAHALIEENDVFAPAKLVVSEKQYEGPEYLSLSFV